MNVTIRKEFDVRTLGKVYRFWIVGKTPVLTHNPASMYVPTGTPQKGGRKIPTPAEEAEAGCYRTDDGKYAIRGESFTEAAKIAGREFEIREKKGPGRGRPPRLSQLMGSVVPTQELLVLVDPDTREPLERYVIDTRRVVVQRQGIMRSRPKFWPWACELEIVADPVLIAGEYTGDLLLQALRHAGNVVGVADYRPGKGGPMGRFDAELVRE